MLVAWLDPRQGEALAPPHGPTAHHRVRDFRVKLNAERRRPIAERLHGKRLAAFRQQHRARRQIEALAVPLIHAVWPGVVNRAAFGGRADRIIADLGVLIDVAEHAGAKLARQHLATEADAQQRPALGQRDRHPVDLAAHEIVLVIGAHRAAEHHRAGVGVERCTGSGSPKRGRRMSRPIAEAQQRVAEPARASNAPDAARSEPAVCRPQRYARGQPRRLPRCFRTGPPAHAIRRVAGGAWNIVESSYQIGIEYGKERTNPARSAIFLPRCGARNPLGDDLVVQSRHLVDWFNDESFGLDCPSFADELVWREAFEGLETAAEIVSGDEVFEMGSELFVVVVVEAFDRRLLDRAVHPFDLSVGPGMLGLCQPVFDTVSLTGAIKRMPAPYGCRS